ncbi:MAG: hypothetical protein PHX43_03915 [Alphaproteobacteria bacterium]|nr:hypothetical protein [Alphaproteobacteria bacterium]
MSEDIIPTWNHKPEDVIGEAVMSEDGIIRIHFNDSPAGRKAKEKFMTPTYTSYSMEIAPDRLK